MRPRRTFLLGAVLGSGAAAIAALFANAGPLPDRGYVVVVENGAPDPDLRGGRLTDESDLSWTMDGGLVLHRCGVRSFTYYLGGSDESDRVAAPLEDLAAPQLACLLKNSRQSASVSFEADAEPAHWRLQL